MNKPKYGIGDTVRCRMSERKVLFVGKVLISENDLYYECKYHLYDYHAWEFDVFYATEEFITTVKILLIESLHKSSQKRNGI